MRYNIYNSKKEIPDHIIQYLGVQLSFSITFIPLKCRPLNTFKHSSLPTHYPNLLSQSMMISSYGPMTLDYCQKQPQNLISECIQIPGLPVYISHAKRKGRIASIYKPILDRMMASIISTKLWPASVIHLVIATKASNIFDISRYTICSS